MIGFLGTLGFSDTNILNHIRKKTTAAIPEAPKAIAIGSATIPIVATAAAAAAAVAAAAAAPAEAAAPAAAVAPGPFARTMAAKTLYHGMLVCY